MVQAFDYKEKLKQQRAIVDGDVAGFVLAHPELTYRQIGVLFSTDYETIRRISVQHGVERKRGIRKGTKRG